MTETDRKRLHVITWGCQMNVYDSDKMADVLRAADGWEPTSDVEQADLVLFNTCSVREKAQEKVFSDLGRVRHLKKKGVLIGVGGCVASQEGEAIVDRAPYVDLVFGPQTLHRLPQMIAAARAEHRPQVDISFPEIEKFDHLPPARVDGVLQEVEALPAGMRASLPSRIKVMAGLNIAERRLPQDGRMRLTVRGHDIDLRVATAPTIHGESVVLRLLDRSQLQLDFDALGFDAAMQARLGAVLAQRGELTVEGRATAFWKTGRRSANQATFELSSSSLS